MRWSVVICAVLYRREDLLRISMVVILITGIVSFNVRAGPPVLSEKKINFVNVPVPECYRPVEPVLSSAPYSTIDTYYRAANKIKGQRDVMFYKQMYVLGRKAADSGHWKAQLMMAELYLRRENPSYYVEYNPQQARVYLDILMRQNVAKSFALMVENRRLYKDVKIPQSAFLFQAAALGDPESMVSVAKIFQTVKRFDDANKLLSCALKYDGGGAALDDLATDIVFHAGKNMQEWDKGFGYYLAAAKSGYIDALSGIMFYDDRDFRPKFKYYYFTNPEYARRMHTLMVLADPLFYHDDISQKGKKRRVQGNDNYRYPNLNKVLPFPPVKNLPPWNDDITVLLSDEDKRDYQTDYDYKRLAKEIQVNGLL